ncbi:34-kDa subunit of RNA polymerase III (C) [Entophlyctis luteolus]|nr:34-kDa subunit of RNA polymerase III (C) [Entophlyctis luteolus]KAJ3350787.1 34-kDa subunit of RNA polymerase III (C) [Entophlyctis luteolus]KAJ3383409.1 34-kDa subunit of RNA polymerase III (C) [Entophlyctis sp. JEL0112]
MSDQDRLLAVIRQHPKAISPLPASPGAVRSTGASEDTLLKELPHLAKLDIVNLVNSLSEQNLVDFVTVGRQLLFKAKDANEANKTRDLSQNEKIVYNFIKAEKTKGIWITDIKSRSGLHNQVVNECIKSLEKFNLIKRVKSVKNPTRRLYMLYDLTPSEEITGGAWYTDQELDVAFIEGLADISFKFISARSYPKAPPGMDAVDMQSTIHPPEYSGYASTRDVHSCLKKSGILKVDLALEDVQTLVDRLWYDGKIMRMKKIGDDRRNNSMSDDDYDEEEESVADMWMYRAVRGESVGRGAPGSGVWGGVWWSEVPCGRCNVRGFCKSGGPVSPEGCVYFSKWLEF